MKDGRVPSQKPQAHIKVAGSVKSIILKAILDVVPSPGLMLKINV